MLYKLEGLSRAGCRVRYPFTILYYTKLLLKQGFKQSTADPCLWILDNKEGYISISTWVDDCVVAYNNKAQWSSIIKVLQHQGKKVQQSAEIRT